MKNKFYFFLTFLLGMLFVFISLLAFAFSSYFMYMIVVLLGMIIVLDALLTFAHIMMGEKKDFFSWLVHLFFGLIFMLFPSLPLSLVVVIFALYITVTGLSHFITYCYYRKEKVNGRIIFLLAAIAWIIVGITFLFSPSVHAREMTVIFAVYTFYLGIKSIGKAIRELLSEDHMNSLKRHIRVSLPVFMVALMPRIVIEYVNGHLEIEEENIEKGESSSLEVFIHVSREGFGAIGHVDICYDGKVIAYGAYDEASTHLFGALGDGVVFIVEKEQYISFCQQDDPTSHIFAYSLYLDDIQRQRIEETMKAFKKELYVWETPYAHDLKAHDYASRLFKETEAQFFKFHRGQFKYYFVMTTNCVLLADHIIGKSGIDIVNMNGIITPGTYFSYFEEESKKENSRVLSKKIY